ncbi:MAG: HAMP domain-containing histidine kinase [Bdellovibrionales bacterium]|nr:HAMP domain-containing histidine kinase [Bdellovibrionales bacterium]
MKADHGRLLLRIFFTYTLTALLIVGALFATYKTLSTAPVFPEIFEQNLIWHLSNLKKELGANPTMDQLRAIEDRFHLQVRMEAAENTNLMNELPTFSEVDESRELRISQNLKLGRANRYFFAEVIGETPRTVWFVHPQTLHRNSAFPFLWVGGFIIFILGMSYLSIRWMMKPLSILFQGARELAEGNLSFRMPLSQRSGFQAIAGDFNEIAEKLQRQVQNRDALLRDVSHELRSPLTRIGVAAEMLQNQEIKASIQEDVQRMSHLVQQILESYRIQSGGLKPEKSEVDLVELMRNLKQEERDLKPEIVLEAPASLNCYVDHMQIERCFRNLLENARKYSRPDSGPIRVLMKLQKPSTEFPQGLAEIVVEDSGLGIAPSELGKIFEPFYRVDKARTHISNAGDSGFGLGLAITRGLVESHGGRIQVQSTLGSGTRFTIQLPLR